MSNRDENAEPPSASESSFVGRAALEPDQIREINEQHKTREEIEIDRSVALLGLLKQWLNDDINPADLFVAFENIAGIDDYKGPSSEYRNKQAVFDEFRDHPEFDKFFAQEGSVDLTAARQALLDALNPVFLDRRNAAKDPITALVSQINNDEINFWDAYREAASIFVTSDYEAEKKIDRAEKAFIKKHVTDAPSNEDSIETFRPKTQADIQDPLKRKFAYETAYMAWARKKIVKRILKLRRKDREHYIDTLIDSGEETEDARDSLRKKFQDQDKTFESAYRAWKKSKNKITSLEQNIKGAKKLDSHGSCRSYFDIAGKPGAPPTDAQIVNFHPPIRFPKRTLCNEIRIDASGTALIDLDANNAEFIAETPHARITTYSVTFVTKNRDDARALKKVLQAAYKCIDMVDHQHPGTKALRDDMYKRVNGGNEYSGPNFIHVDGCKVIPKTRFDLDDLWLLYCLIEPAIEPSQQIAQAMNAARYAEERGSPILPAGGAGMVGDATKISELGALPKRDDSSINLEQAIANSFIDLALKKITTAEFYARTSSFADQTLLGGITDQSQSLSTYQSLIANQNSGHAVTTYPQALVERNSDLIRAALGMQADDPRDMQTVLHDMVEKLRLNLAQDAREEAASDALRQAQEHMNALARSFGASSDFTPEGVDQEHFERVFAATLSDLNAGRKAPQFDDVKNEIQDDPDAPKTGLQMRSGLVIADSQVEQCADGIHRLDHGVIYISKMKGSMFVRYELPDQLQAFMDSEESPTLAALTLSPKAGH